MPDSSSSCLVCFPFFLPSRLAPAPAHLLRVLSVSILTPASHLTSTLCPSPLPASFVHPSADGTGGSACMPLSLLSCWHVMVALLCSLPLPFY